MDTDMNNLLRQLADVDQKLTEARRKIPRDRDEVWLLQATKRAVEGEIRLKRMGS